MIATPKREASQPMYARALGWLNSFTKGSAPSQRTVSSAYAQIENAQGEDVGAFVLGLYQLAKKPAGLRNQRFQSEFIRLKKQARKTYQFSAKDLLNSRDRVLRNLVEEFYPEKSDKDLKQTLKKIHASLYHTQEGPLKGQAKSAFELALLPTTNRTDIQKRLRAEYTWQQDHGYLPQEIFRLRLEEWLGRLQETEYRIKEDGNKELCITLDNKKPKTKEDQVHYLMGATALILTMSFVLATVVVMTNPLFAVMAGFAALVVNDTANQFTTYGVGEWLWRDLRWNLSKNFLSTDNIDRKKAFRSTILFACVGYAAYMGATAVFAATLGSSLLSALSPIALQAFAGTAAVWSFATTLIGLTAPIHALQGLGFHNNQIDPKQIPVHLPKVTPTERARSNCRLSALKERLGERGFEVSFDPYNPTVVYLVDRDEEEAEAEAAPRARKALRKKA